MVKSPPATPKLAAATLRPGAGPGIFLAQIIRLGLRLGSAAVLARLLTPEAYGLQGMAAAVFGFLYMTRDCGIVPALQQPDVTPATFAAMCRLGVFGGLALTLIGAALAVPTGWFFHETERVPWVLAAMSTSFVFAGAAAPAIGLLHREQRARTVAFIETAAFAVAAGAAVAAATAGWDVWSLVLFSVVNEAAVCALAWRSCPWRPGRPEPGLPWRQMVRFSANLTGHNLATHARNILDQIIVGRSAGVTALGLYGRAAQLAALPVQFGIGPFSAWAMASLGRLREEPAAYARFFRHLLNSLAHVAFAAAATCMAVPELALTVLFGPAWITAAPVTRWLGLAIAFQPWLQAPAWLVHGPGDSRRLLYWSLAGAAAMATAGTIAAPFGPAAIALAAAGVIALQASLAPWLGPRGTGLELRDWWQPAVVPLALHAGLGLLLAGASHLVPAAWPAMLQAGALAALATAYYSLALGALPALRAELRQHAFLRR